MKITYFKKPLHKWYKWFAWRPVFDSESHSILWLELVWKKQAGFNLEAVREYKRINKTNE